MYGIIRQHDEAIMVSSIFVIKDNDWPFDKAIENHKWFSEDGITLKSEEILAKQKEYFSLKRNYEERYRELLGRSRGNPRMRDEEYLCCINNTFFHAGAFSKLPHKLFSGMIDGSTQLRGEQNKRAKLPCAASSSGELQDERRR